MPVTVVVGTQWGDEGKAKIIDLLAETHQVVARYQGGHNAGHTVVVGDQKYALQLVPSGVFYSHVTPVIGNGVVVDLPTLFNEIDTLESRGVTCARLRVSSLAHLIFPWHQSHDAISESGLGENKIGTTLKGIGPAYADKARRVGIRAGDVRDPQRFKNLVRERAIAEQKVLTALGGEQLDVDSIVEKFSHLGARLAPYVADTVNFLHDALDRKENLLLEGAQATFLDIDHGTYPFVTSSNPIAGGACAGSGLGPRDITLGLIVFADVADRGPETARLLTSQYWQDLRSRHRVAIYTRATNETVGKAFLAELKGTTGPTLLIRDNDNSQPLAVVPL
ncbi:MAG: adenylosuccinate synthetase, partial [Actinomycetota bacterium]